MLSEKNTEQCKVVFELEPDEGGYPPVGSEKLWAERVGPSNYRINNIPFFVRDISPDDIVEATEIDGELIFRKVTSPSMSSVLRVLGYDQDRLAELRKTLPTMGCSVEGDYVASLIAVEIPSSTSLKLILDLLREGETRGWWEFEEASLRQSAP